MLQLQQLGLPLGFRSHVEWWEDYLINNFHQLYEQNGEAYYVNPDDLKGHYLKRPADAFKIMREFGLGITNNNIRKIDVGEIN